MGFQFTPRIKIGNVTIGRRGASVGTGVPGLRYRMDFKGSSGQQQPSEPVASAYGIKSVIIDLVLFVLASTVPFILGAIFGKILGYVACAVLLWVALQHFMKTGEYGQKQETVYVQDKRYKTGHRPNGTRLVKDESNFIEYDSQQLTLHRIVGTVQLLFTAAVALFIYVSK
ncbi:hypothetical protein DYU11_22765 [Fibrisoma montanum]|uniref:Uncharacterized protein n=1 Tax=Fibrisoma montanum TaxID=2305895 RepID=A0A418M277_9BACT|nr:hypothetical protein [Fibrisoma montanum]RIV19755.1 hypothetical protein DYU11_22765 [Fibrisoma montanum]